MTRKRLGYLEVLCINLFAIHGLRVLPIAIFLFFVPLLNESNSLYVNKGTQNILKQNRTLMCLDNFAYFCIVLCILLIISGVEQNPGPSLSVSSRSFSSVSDLSSDCSVFKNNVSFHHLNVQSIVPKLDIITAEYSSYDILSFTESWLKLIEVIINPIDWDSMFTGHDIDSITCSTRQTINDIANDTIPNRIISIRKDNPPWLTTAIKKNKFDAKKEFINEPNRRT
jgi:hypothetical protein